MEDTLRGFELIETTSERSGVLILVLMEDTLRDKVFSYNFAVNCVLILVLMEDTLRVVQFCC